MSDLITPHDFVDDCDCHQCSLRARDQLRTEVDRLRNIEAAAVAAVDFDQWQGDAWYESMMALQKALADSTEAVCQNCDGTGDVTNQIGEYLGRCNCGAPSMFQAELAREDVQNATDKARRLEDENERLLAEVSAWRERLGDDYEYRPDVQYVVMKTPNADVTGLAPGKDG